MTEVIRSLQKNLHIDCRVCWLQDANIPSSKYAN